MTSPRTTRKPPPLRAEPRGHGAFRAVDSRSRPAKRIVRNAPIVYLTACGAACRKNKNQRDSSQLFVKLPYRPQCELILSFVAVSDDLSSYVTLQREIK